MTIRVKGHGSGHRPATAITAVSSATGGGTLGAQLPSRMPASTGAQYWWDPVNGSNFNSGLAASAAWLTAAKAVSAVPLGAVVNVVGNGVTVGAGGNVAGLVWDRAGGDTTNPTTFRCQTNRGVTISTGLAANSNVIKYAMVVKQGAVRFEGFKIGGRGYDAANGEGNVGIRLDSTATTAFAGVEFYDCEITGCGGQGVYSVAAVPRDISDVWFYRCLFHDNALDARAGLTSNTDGYYGNKGTHHMYIGDDQGSDTTVQKGGYRWVIASCVFKGSMPGRHVQMGAQARSFIVTCNTFYGNTGLPMNGVPAKVQAGDAVVFFTTGTGAYATGSNLVINNIMASCVGAAVYGSGPEEFGNYVDNNLAYALDCQNSANDGWSAAENYPNKYGASGPTLFQVGTNRPEADPLFTSAATGNFVLLSGSPAAGVANPDYTPDLKYDGTVRSTTAPNLGAF